MPVKDICSAAASCGCRVLVDGAHALGQIPIDIADLAPDYYVANCHKWMMCCRGSGFMFVRPQLQAQMLPTVISSNGPGSFQKMFEYTGTKDYTPHLSFTAALDFRAQFGEEQLRGYMRNLSQQGSKLLADSWSTQCIAPDDMTGCLLFTTIITITFSLVIILHPLMSISSSSSSSSSSFRQLHVVPRASNP